MRRFSLGIVGIGLFASGTNACTSDPIEPSKRSTAPDLSYKVKRYLPGLDETVEIVKTPSQAYAHRRDGTKQGLASVIAEEKAAHRLRFGALDPRDWIVLKDSPPSADVAVTIAYTSSEPRMLGQVLGSADQGTRLSAQARFVGELEPRATTVAARLSAAGLKQVRPSKAVPLVFAVGTPEVILEAARDPDVQRVALSFPAVPVENAAPTHPDSTLNILTWQTDFGYNAANRTIGLIDPGNGCRVRSSHGVFANNTITHSSTFQTSCTNSSQCDSACTRGVCVSGKCVDSHNTEIASVIAQVLPQVDMRVAVRQGEVACDPIAIDEAYSDFVVNGVQVVNESFRCYDNQPTLGRSEQDGLVQDTYARNYGIVVTKAAGNKYSWTEEDACPHSLNAVCVGGVRADQTQACLSSWHNPGWGKWSNDTDREEPDVMALSGDGPIASGPDCNSAPAGNVKVARPTSNSLFYGQAGTSYASPAIASLATLLIDACEGEGKNISPWMVRALLRTGAFHSNPDGWKYSTLKPGFDWKDGGGFIDGREALGYCIPGPANIVVGGGTFLINIAQDGGDPPPQDIGYPPEPPGGTASMNPSLKTQDQSWQPFMGGRKAMVVEEFFNIEAGQRFRATFSWDACPTGASSAPIAVHTDFDLYLYNATTGQYLYGSQTLDDNNEGFDITFPTSGHYQVWVSWPTGLNECDSWWGTFEPSALSWVLIL